MRHEFLNLTYISCKFKLGIERRRLSRNEVRSSFVRRRISSGTGHVNLNHAIEEFAMTRRQDSLVAPVMFFAAWFGCFAMMVLHFG